MNDNESTLNETPSAGRLRIAFFGLRNAGKSTLVNDFTGQDVAIVSDTPGTTTDPVSKAMEILPLGPCLVTDTAGLDDEGELGRQRVEKTLKVLETTDIAVWVSARKDEDSDAHRRFVETCAKRNVVVFEFARGDSVVELRRRIASVRTADDTPGLLDGLVGERDRVTCVCPIDASAPKGRLILPQVQVIRECLDRHLVCRVCQVEEFVDDGSLVITDSQAFGRVKAKRLTSFSILFARQKGDLDVFRRGLEAIGRLVDGDTVLVAEGCTHHRQCNDIGSVKIPKALAKLTGRKLAFTFASGRTFGDFDREGRARPALVVHCGGCMLTRREMMRRIRIADAAGVPIVNYGLLLAAAAGQRTI